MDTGSLESLISSNIRTNGTNAITGDLLQSVLLAMVSSGRMVDLGTSDSADAMDAAVKSEAVRVAEGAVGGLPDNEVIYAAYSDGSALRKYTYWTQTTETATYLYRLTPGGQPDRDLTTDGGTSWSGWESLSNTLTAGVLDLGELSGVSDFTDRLGTSAVLRSGKSVVVGRSTTSDGYESLYLCLQAVNVNSGTARQYVFANNSGSDAVNGWRVRVVRGVKSGSYDIEDWRRAMPQRFWLNSNRYLAVGEYSEAQGASLSGGVANVDLAGLFISAVTSRTNTAYTVTHNVAGQSRTVTLSAASTSYAGVMTATDKSKLDGIAEGADVTSVTQGLTSGVLVGTVNGTRLYAPEPSAEADDVTVEAAFGEYNTGLQVGQMIDALDTGGGQTIRDASVQFQGALMLPDGTEIGGPRFWLVGTVDGLSGTTAVKTWTASEAPDGCHGSEVYNEDEDAWGKARMGVIFKNTPTGTRYYRSGLENTALTVFTEGGGSSGGGELSDFSVDLSTYWATFSVTVGEQTRTATLPVVTASAPGLMRSRDYASLNSVVEQAAELEAGLAAEAALRDRMPAVAACAEITVQATLSQAGEGYPVFFATYDEAASFTYGEYNNLFTPSRIVWAGVAKEPDTSGTVYGQHRFFLLGRLDIPLSEETLELDVAVASWGDDDLAGYPGSWAYNEDDDADGYARMGVLFKSSEGVDYPAGVYYRAYGEAGTLEQLI